MRFVVIVQKDKAVRAFGPYRSSKSAGGDAQAWDGFVVRLEAPETAPSPWDAYNEGKPTKRRMPSRADFAAALGPCNK